MITDAAKVRGFDFTTRNRRPPTDPINAVLSYVYGLLVKDLTVTALAVGLDPYQGVYHRPRFGRPALALDLAEEFRPLIGDSVTVTVLNNGQLAEHDFVVAFGYGGLGKFEEDVLNIGICHKLGRPKEDLAPLAVFLGMLQRVEKAALWALANAFDDLFNFFVIRCNRREELRIRRSWSFSFRLKLIKLLRGISSGAGPAQPVPGSSGTSLSLPESPAPGRSPGIPFPAGLS